MTRGAGPAAWNNLGMAYAVAHENRRVRDAFAEAVRPDPDDAQARANLARVTLECGDACD